MYVNTVCLQALKHNIHKIQKTPLSCNFSAKQTYAQTQLISHTGGKKEKKTRNHRSVNTNSVETSKIWQKRRLQDAIQTIIKTKYASFLAQCRGDQWEIGRDVINACFCYQQPTLMFLIGLK